ncbi:MAG: hypothetical protein J0G94_15285 [Sphingomonadales bacterium]|nr:hypothetical protein [Sphingomonadales bacterium]
MTALSTFTQNVHAAWRPLSTELIEECQRQAEALLDAAPSEDWLAALHRERPANQELYRDPDHGFVLLAHTEQQGLFRPPHDHGRAWVMYAVQSGEIEMRTYTRVEDPRTGVRLVRRDATRVQAGQVQVYLPGDIHDTRCLSDSALLFRFTERDLRVEDKVHHQVTRYIEQNGVWTARPEPAERPLHMMPEA